MSLQCILVMSALPPKADIGCSLLGCPLVETFRLGPNRLSELGHASPCAIMRGKHGFLPSTGPSFRVGTFVCRETKACRNPSLISGVCVGIGRRPSDLFFGWQQSKWTVNESFTLRRHHGKSAVPPSCGRHRSLASILPKRRQLNGAFAAYLTRRWVPRAIRFYAWAVHSKAFHIRSCGWRGSSRRPAAIWTG